MTVSAIKAIPIASRVIIVLATDKQKEKENKTKQRKTEESKENNNIDIENDVLFKVTQAYLEKRRVCRMFVP